MAQTKPTKNDLIVQAVYDAMAGKYPIEQAPMFCLKVVRQVVERAFGWSAGTFHKNYWKEKVEENKTKEPWARDVQRSLRNMGKQIPFNERQAGDLVFIWQAAFPYGHVGILMFDGDFIFENAPGDRGFEKGNIRISHLSEIRHSVEVFRF
jgi:cell wall-associated NlpC family hydrolase